MHLLLPIILVFALIFGPGWWVRNVMSRYSKPEDRYDGSGGELARHLLDSLDLQNVKVEETSKGDHYDPQEKVIRLTPGNLNGHSLTAVTVAAHEVGHALQDASGYAPLKIRSQLITLTRPVERLGGRYFDGCTIYWHAHKSTTGKPADGSGWVDESRRHQPCAPGDPANRAGCKLQASLTDAGKGRYPQVS